MSGVPLNPKPFVQSLIGKQVHAKLKWGQEYTGFLVAVDSYLNLQMQHAEEFCLHESNGMLGEIFIRCVTVNVAATELSRDVQGDALLYFFSARRSNNLLYIRGV
mmetsp:Transcript_25994/g.88935  ORF Transcript_25994/g.88935 Transcript_25994/m.88935 type:complete len:105 (+) Transcript_25994:199-513(+)